MKVVCSYIDENGNESPTLELHELLDPSHRYGLTPEQRARIVRRYFKILLEASFPGAEVRFKDDGKERTSHHERAQV